MILRGYGVLVARQASSLKEAVKFRLDRTNCVYLHDFDMCHLFDHTA